METSVTKVEGQRKPREPDPTLDRLYRAAMLRAGCVVVGDERSWIAVSPAGVMWGILRAP